MANKLRVLLADDHAVVRKGVREILEYEVDMEVVGEATDGQQAVDLALALRPDVVVMDVSMPVLTGIEATRRIRVDAPEVKVVALSAYDDQPYVRALLAAGASGYILKTSDAAELVRAVRDVYHGQTALDPELKPLVNGGVANTPGTALSEREREVLQLAAAGLTNKQIGLELSISDRTVQNHLQNIFGKLGVQSRTEAVTAGLKAGEITLGK